MGDDVSEPAGSGSPVAPPRGAVSARRRGSTDANGGGSSGEPSGRPDGAAGSTLVPDPAPYQARWSDIQVAFVDSPRDAVRDADALVADLIQRLVDTFAAERADLEAQWDRGDDVSTEQLRVTLQRYRSFFDRLLAM